MQQYQPFYPQMNSNYQTPTQNPYMDRMTQLQQYQQSLQQPIVPTQTPVSNQMSALGKMVDSIDVVKATDIPMDGNTYYFPKADGTEIFGKQWLPNGQTRILTFKPALDTEDNNVLNADEKLKIALSDEATDVFMKRFDELENKISKFEQLLTKTSTKTSTSRTKKEADAE